MMMRFATVPLLILCLSSKCHAGPSKPEVSIGINSDGFDKGALGALEPHVDWETSGTFEGCDVSGGVSMVIKDADDMPYGLWGKIKGSVAGIGLSAKVKTHSSNMNKWGLDLQASADSIGGGTTLQVTGDLETKEPSVTLADVKVTQKVETSLGAFVISPKYNVGSQTADVRLAYGRGDTTVTIDANADRQKLTVSQAIGDANVVTPCITTDGDVELGYTRSIGPGALTAAYKPDSHAKLIYDCGPWVGTVTAPLDGMYKFSSDVKFNIRRSIDVTTLGM